MTAEPPPEALAEALERLTKLAKNSNFIRRMNGKEADALAADLRLAIAALTDPAMVLVPREPTKEQTKAAMTGLAEEAWRETLISCPDRPPAGTEPMLARMWDVGFEAGFLAAHPRHEGEVGEWNVSDDYMLSDLRAMAERDTGNGSWFKGEDASTCGQGADKIEALRAQLAADQAEVAAAQHLLKITPPLLDRAEARIAQLEDEVAELVERLRGVIAEADRDTINFRKARTLVSAHDAKRAEE